ncbi:unnamed protein product [Cuscuta campestris]|uniref:Retrotransposon gag domain-containing protein n=1 Tax=Cuscuta campestris TaxID=132261 RepID=A0A484LUN8_9ASTE|nr:unnamed protein product [Cuscuta campestris]
MEAQLKTMESRFAGVDERINAQDLKLDQIMMILKKLESKARKGKEGASASEGDGSHSNARNLNFNPKLEFPRFDGSNTRNWIKKASKYFTLCKIPEEQWVDIASLYMVERAENWMSSYLSFRKFVSWHEFIIDLSARFRDDRGHNVVEQFKKLEQKGSLEDYIDEFEDLRFVLVQNNHYLPDSYILDCFVGGLKASIRLYVRAFKPSSIAQAIEYARLKEESLEVEYSKYSKLNKPPAHNSSKPPLLPTPQTKPANFQPNKGFRGNLPTAVHIPAWFQGQNAGSHPKPAAILDRRIQKRSSKLFASDKKGSTKDWKPFFVFVSTGPESPFTGSGRPSFRRIPRPPPDATLLSITRQFCNKGVMNIKEVVTEETLAGLGFEFVQDELRHQPDLLRDIPGGHQPDQLKDIPEEGLDCGPFVEIQDSGEEMDSNLLLSRFTAGRKRKRETRGQGKRSSSHHEEGPSREPVVIAVEDQEDATQEPGTMAGQSPPHPVMQGGDLAGSSQGTALGRPPSPLAMTYEVATEGRSTRLCIPPLPQSLGDVQLETLITLPAEDQARISAGSEDDLDNMVLLRLSQATLGMIEVVGRRRGRQAAADDVMKAAEAKQKELQEEVARLTRELKEKENRCAALTVEKASQENRCVALEADKASLSLEVESVSARVVELEGEKSDLIQQLEVERNDRVRHAEGAVESFKSSPDFTVVALERMEELTAAWLKTEPGAQWMVKEGTKSFNCGLFHAQQVFHNRLAQLPKGFSLPDLGFPPPCRSLAEFDPSPYLDGGSSSASEEEEEEEMEGVWAQLLVPARLPARAQSLDWPSCRPIDPMPFAVSDWNFARLKAALSIFPTGRLLLRRSLPLPPSQSIPMTGGLDPYEFCRRLPRRQWPSVKPPPPPPNPYEDFSEAYEALSANRLPDGRIDWDAPCPLHSLQCMAWESFQDEQLPLLEHECAYYASLERWTSESRTNSPVRPTEEVVLGEELGSSLPRPACHSLPQKTPRRPEVARAASGSLSSPR